jgi:hypothetical protein
MYQWKTIRYLSMPAAPASDYRTTVAMDTTIGHWDRSPTDAYETLCAASEPGAGIPPDDAQNRLRENGFTDG